MALSSLDAIVVADEAVDDSSARYRRLCSLYGEKRGRALSRIVLGLPASPGYAPPDAEQILAAVADAILER
ncbi:hypothetical protein [Novipirellula artificiosorum]|uniref:Uncharacterized protein n=1 Tax=Novipirellula artificiosorum TaxID=2528016 RepID=A0A5C6DM82_9BACT|nr:hypothetical protein [Novipirellula artificiosorum]TWU36026.1 hypothetical protein Poly41_37790 [Novipirellula artificiosorum]